MRFFNKAKVCIREARKFGYMPHLTGRDLLDLIFQLKTSYELAFPLAMMMILPTLIPLVDGMGADVEGISLKELEEESEVFKLPDGKYMIVEG